MPVPEESISPKLRLPPPRGPVLRDVMRQHAEEIGVLRMQRLALRFSAESTPRALVRIDARIAAHRDGLATGAPASVDIATEAIAHAFDPWELAALVETLFALGDPDRSFVEGRLLDAKDPLLGGWFEGLRHANGERIAWLAELLPALGPQGPCIAPIVAALGWHGRLDRRLAAAALSHDDPQVRCALARALCWSAPIDADPLSVLRPLLTDRHIGVRRRAVWTCVVRDPSAGLAALRELAREDGDPFAIRALELIEGRQAPSGASPEEQQAAELDRRALAEAAAADPTTVPNLLLWRVAMGRDRADLAALRRETPSRFFEDEPGDEIAPEP